MTGVAPVTARQVPTTTAHTNPACGRFVRSTSSTPAAENPHVDETKESR